MAGRMNTCEIHCLSSESADVLVISCQLIHLFCTKDDQIPSAAHAQGGRGWRRETIAYGNDEEEEQENYENEEAEEPVDYGKEGDGKKKKEEQKEYEKKENG